eukprot:jgi/Mesvir1/26276/Mv01640-RA.1
MSPSLDTGRRGGMDFSSVHEQAHGFIFSLLHNEPLLVALLSFLGAQACKVVTAWYKDGRWDMRRLLGSGGMPSSHTALVTGLTTSVGFGSGFDSPLYAACVVFTLVVMYDATGVRLQAGRQAEVLNQIIFELPPEHPVSDLRPLREAIGHTIAQVGSILLRLIKY